MADLTTEEKLKKLKEENPISSKIAGTYEVVGIIPGVVAFGGKNYDLRNIDKKTAERLVENNFPYLKKKLPTATESKGK